MEKFIFKSVIWTLIFISVAANSNDVSEEVRTLAKQVEEMKNLHGNEVSMLKKEIAELKKHAAKSTTIRKNEQTLYAAIKNIKTEVKLVARRVNNSIIQNEINNLQNDMAHVLARTSTITQDSHTLQQKNNYLNDQVNGLTVDHEQLRTMLSDLRQQYIQLSNEVKELSLPKWSDVQLENETDKEEKSETHKFRHNKAVHHQINKLARTQNQMEHNQQTLGYQVTDAIKRIEKMEKYDINGLSNMIAVADLRVELIQDYFTNISHRVSDMDNIHRSLLELREEVEGIENKADKTLPDFRKEISKLDVSYAQVNAQVSYLREGQENLRQSVKAIAVSVSNTMDRAELDRRAVKCINDTVADLEAKSKQHFHRLNDHILKAETNYATAPTEEIPLPELMDEVKELEPVDQEFKDLVNKLPHDCSTISGPPDTYLIHPGHAPINTWCNNGSTLLQRRYNGSIEFNRKFNEYVNGFGNPASEYWLGLEAMHLLTADNCSSMRIDMVDIYGAAWYAEYGTFYVGSSDTGYVLEVSGFQGNASDAFEYQNHMEFSAIDHDRDISNTHCAGNYEGGWWFSHCQHVNINGKYNLGLTWFDSGKNEWIAVATSEMRMYRKC